MRIRKKPWTKQELAENPFVLRNPEQYARKIADYFNNDNPLHLELGCGKGRFISTTANNNPNVNHIAVEREPTVLAVAARLAKQMCQAEQTEQTEQKSAQLIFLELDAAKLCDYFNPQEISRLYINFCDPWPRRKKWAKRRLTHTNFLKIYESLQIPEIFFKTDNRILFEFSINQFSENGWIMRNISLDLHNSNFEDNVKTEYEEKFSKLGPIYRLEAYKF
ncbi:MAG: tRNA (guanosine(46)-N7)-methyltransferase TrmB [Firmicutes bacterium]|nr:tRNA (guanosine(46)-N7)-methyltransferase TrmB [Bacillota bacterium]